MGKSIKLPLWMSAKKKSLLKESNEKSPSEFVGSQVEVTANIWMKALQTDEETTNWGICLYPNVKY